MRIKIKWYTIKCCLLFIRKKIWLYVFANSLINDHTIKIIEPFLEKEKSGRRKGGSESKEKEKDHDLEYSLYR